MPPTQSPAIGQPPRRRRRTLGTIAPEIDERQKREAEAEQAKLSLAEKKRVYLQALQSSMGLFGVACRATGINFYMVKHWRLTDPDFKEACEEIEQYQVDMVEAALLKKICPPASSGERPDTKAMCFYLASKGSRNGYQRTYKERGADTITPAALVDSREDDDEPFEMDEEALAKAVEILSTRAPVISPVIDIQAEQ